jgi:hypothetical protein
LVVIFVVAAAGGGIGLVVARRFFGDSPQARNVLIMIPAMLAGVFGREIASSYVIRDLFTPPSRMERAARKYEKELRDSPGFKSKLAGRTAEQQKNEMKELAHAGLRRLATVDLESWNRLRLALAELSAPLCTGFWSGQFDPKIVQESIEKLPDPQLDEWMRISLHASQLELDDKTDGQKGDIPIDRVFELVAAKLPAADSTRLQKAIAQGMSLDAGEACWTMQTILKTVGTLEPANREVALRALAQL